MTSGDPFRNLTWGDLTLWVGKPAVAQGRTQQKAGAVRQLNKTETGALIAWVHDEEDFATLVEIEQGDLFGQCTCQADGCEHMVAVLIEYIANLRRNIVLPVTGSKDPRFFLL